MHDPAAPASYPQRCLLAVTGLSPQIVTETLHALTVAAVPAFIPTRIEILTTGEDGNARSRPCWTPPPVRSCRSAASTTCPGWPAR